ncbi:MAG: nodulation protein nolNO, partial [Bacteroidetes bacterium]|nr:nodulation protein nolNO [Bacteroidota bacterium]
FVKTLNELYPKAKIKFRRYDHHLTHAALACYGSPYEEGTCAIIDGSGEKGSYTYYSYENNTITRLKEQRGVASLGYFYIMLTLLCGFDPDKGEQWKVMGLAPYGKRNDRAYYLLKSLYNLDSKGFRMNVMKWPALLKELFTFSRKENESPLSVADLAYTGQIVFSEWIDLLLKDAHKRGNSDNLIYSGGCALNSAYNGLITERTPFQSLYVPSAPGDDGNALGAALMSYYQAYPARESKHKNISPYLGSEFTSRRMDNFLKFSQLDNIEHLPNGNIYEAAAKLLSEGKIIGWVQGKAEFGPRALGNRSILADPRYPGMKEKINARVKFREAFRPFAPSILDEYGDTYFENYQPSPYMERTLVFRESVRDKIPAVVHQNGTGRLQSVSPELNPRYYRLIKAFHRITGVPVLLNTSFNVMGKPIIHSIEDAISVFYTTGLDALVIGDYLILKQEEDVKMVEDVLEMA